MSDTDRSAADLHNEADQARSEGEDKGAALDNAADKQEEADTAAEEADETGDVQ